VILRAIRDIVPGEELAYDYNLYDGDLEDSAVCLCGAKRCRGSMYAPKELLRRKKLAKKKAEAKRI
jgi:hypothetical protein